MSAKQADIPRVLHCHSSFSKGGKELRCVQLINALGRSLRHSIVSAQPDAMGAAENISPNALVDYPKDFPSLQGKPWPGRLLKLARALQSYDLVLTYNWGAMDAVMAHTLFSDALALPPLIHHEDGFNEDEAQKLKPGRNWYRRIGLGKAVGLVVPSERLEEIALTSWQQPFGRVRRIANGIDTAAFAKAPKPDGLRGIVKRDGEMWVGTLAGLRAVKNLPALVRAAAKLPEQWQLVIAGEGPEKDMIRAEADRLEFSHRLHLPGHVPDPSKIVGLFDIFALSSHSEQFPISLVEAMAAGKPVAAYSVGDIGQMVSEANLPYIAAAEDELALTAALERLASDAAERGVVGEENRNKARAEYDEKKMIESYRRLYASALGREI